MSKIAALLITLAGLGCAVYGLFVVVHGKDGFGLVWVLFGLMFVGLANGIRPTSNRG